ncbi:DNA-directed DNA polymerase [Tanacetum coccineum]
MIDCDVKGVTTRGGKTTTQDVHDNNTNVLPKEPLVVELEKPVRSNKVLTNDQPQMTSEPVVQPTNETPTPPVPFPRRLRKEIEEAQHKCSAVLLNKLPSKEKDLGSFTIPCNIGQLHIDNALADLGASICLMPYTMYKKLGFGEPKATRMNFIILDMPEDSRVPIILGRPFLETARAMIDIFNKKITLRVEDDEIIFDVDQSTKIPTTKDDECYGIDDLDKTINDEAQELLANKERDSYQRTTNGDDVISEHLYSASANEIDEEIPELKNLPQHLEYAYLHGDKSFPIIISSKLSEEEKISLL